MAEEIEDYKQVYIMLKENYNDLQADYWRLDRECNNLSCELENLRCKVGDFHINESPLGWAIMGSSTHEKMFLAKDKGWDREKIEQMERLLEGD